MTNLSIRGVKTEVDDDLEKYVIKKIGKLNTYVPRHARENTSADVTLETSKAKDKRESSCEVTFTLPHETLHVKETTVNMYAAIDIVEARLKNRLLRYKFQTYANKHRIRHALARMRHRLS